MVGFSSEDQIMRDLDRLVREGKMHIEYLVICPYCDTTTEKYFKKKEDIPEDMVCPHCGHIIRQPVKYINEVCFANRKFGEKK